VASLDGIVAAALAVLALAYPLLGPGSPAELLATGRPTLVVQGGGDPFGRSGQFPPLPPEMEMVEIPSAHHTFGTRTGIPRSADDPHHTAVTEWIDGQLAAAATDDRLRREKWPSC
jgi:uncharacterized protein